MAVSPPHTFISPHIFYSYIVPPPFHLRSHFFCRRTLRTSIPPFRPSVCICRSASIRQHVQHFFPCWFLASSPSLLFRLLFAHPHLPPPLIFPFSHVCQGPGGSTLCTAQWPKSECLRNCQLSPIIRGSP